MAVIPLVIPRREALRWAGIGEECFPLPSPLRGEGEALPASRTDRPRGEHERLFFCSIYWIRRVGKFDALSSLTKDVRTNPLRDDT